MKWGMNLFGIEGDGCPYNYLPSFEGIDNQLQVLK
jgi:hypothetical protein